VGGLPAEVDFILNTPLVKSRGFG